MPTHTKPDLTDDIMLKKRPTLRHNIITGTLLVMIVLLGGYFRYNGLNWDDFSGMHPDERFMTWQVLANTGGGLEFTPDNNFPAQSLLVRMGEMGYTYYSDIENTGFDVGAVVDTSGADLVRWWLGDERAVIYDTPDAAINGLFSGDVIALVFDPSVASMFMGSTTQIDTFSSIQIQRLRCNALYPQTNGIGGFFDARCSPLNPINTGNGFFTYGTLPVFLAHGLNLFVEQQDMAGSSLFDYEGEAMVFRALSAFFDVGTIIFIFFIGARLHTRWTGLLAALLYACAPHAIQESHYGTVNATAAFFTTWALWAATGVQYKNGYWHYLVFGIAYGSAVASRINLAPLAGVVVLAAIVQCLPAFDRRLSWNERYRILSYHFGGLVLAGITSIVAFRIGNPYAFEGPGFFGLRPDERFFANIAAGQFGVSGLSEIPPNWQWLGRPPYVYPLKDMILWGMGIALGLTAWVGFVWSGFQLVRGRAEAMRNILLFAWVFVYFAWIGRLWVMTMRYYLPLYGALALFAAWAIIAFAHYAHKNGRDIPLVKWLLIAFGLIFTLIPAFYLANGFELTITAITAGIIGGILLVMAFIPVMNKRRAWALGGFVVLFSLLWAFMFSNIYNNQLTRVQASRWLWENIPGDFAMQIDGAPEGTPLINLSIRNTVAVSAKTPQEMFDAATRLNNGAPIFIDFTPAESGTIHNIIAPHLGDPNDDAELETIEVIITQQDADGIPNTLAIGSLTNSFRRDNHLLGDMYRIPLDTPVAVQAGETYRAKIEVTAGGTLLTSGSVVLTEGDWDDRLPSIKICTWPSDVTLSDNVPPGFRSYEECQGIESWFALIQSYDLYMHYAPDSEFKQQHTIEALHQADYYTITSNRFYDGVFRNRLRWPFASFFYEKLFAGELGFERVATFTESFELGPLQVSDQHLPTYRSPDWFNEFEADEAFHVYDHPAVFVFKKRPDYDPQRVSFLLNSVSVNRPQDVSYLELGAAGSQFIGMVDWTTFTADQAPTHLMLTPEKQLLQQQGGTWSDRFDSESILFTNQPLGVAVWWLTIVLIGWLAWPILFVAFPKLADRGYAFAKTIGLLLVAWFAWAISSLSVPLWSQGGIIVCLLAMAAFSARIAWIHRDSLREYLRDHGRRLFWIEVITLVLFLILIGVRLSNPDLWHFSKGGEKPMDFAYFNAVLRSTTFPAYDPWYADGYINYYYFGFVLVGSPVLLLKMVPSFAYNLIIPTIFALTGIGAFSAAFTLVDSWRERRRQAYLLANQDADEAALTTRRRMGNPWLAGFAALMLCVVLGNLDTIRVIGVGVAQLGGYQTPQGLAYYLKQEYQEQYGVEPAPEAAYQLDLRAEENRLQDRLAYEIDTFTNTITSLGRGIGRALSGATLPIGSDRWYWGPSRVIAEIPDVGGSAITEMPYFTFLYGDLHAHMIAMPLMLFAVAFVLHEVLIGKNDRRQPFAIIMAVVLGGATVGLLRATNTWDWPTFMLFGTIGLGYAWWRRWEIINRWSLAFMLAYIGGFIVISFAAALPYSAWYAATYNSAHLWEGGKTPIWAYFDIHGLFLFLFVSFFIWETARWLRSVKVRAMRGQGHWVIATLTATTFILGGLLGIAMMQWQVVIIAVPLILWVAVLFFRPQQAPEVQYVLVLIGLGLAITTGVEFVVLAGDIGRQNTVFKFYIQVWLIFSVAGGAILAWLLEASDRWIPRLRVSWTIPLLILFGIAAMFPFMATRGRSMDRQAWQTPVTLDGMEFMRHAQHNLMDYGTVISLEPDYHIIRWLQENVEGTPTIMEGRSQASEYRWNGRISIYTGLPSVLGWNWHQRQQRTFEPLHSLIAQRELNIKHFYETPHIPEAVAILRHYDVAYVIVSDMERTMARQSGSEDGIEKFETMAQLGLFENVFEQGDGTVYAVNQAMLDAYAFTQAQQEQTP